MKNGRSKDGKCVLYDRDCIDCGECEFCDLNPLKICDNCGKCLHMDDYATIKIDGIFDQIDHARGHDDDCSCGCHDHDHDDGCDCGCHDRDHSHAHKHNNKVLH